MIRKWKPADTDAVMELWLMGNTEKHSFVPAKYWRQNFSEIKRVVSIACTYVYEHKGKIKGFISAMDGFLLGIFVDADIRGHGMGLVLIDCMKQREPSLTANVYVKNTDAVKFFQRQGFQVQSEIVDESTGEKQLMLVWEKEERK